jgi:hypothetical protein
LMARSRNILDQATKSIWIHISTPTLYNF